MDIHHPKTPTLAFFPLQYAVEYKCYFSNQKNPERTISAYLLGFILGGFFIP